MYIYIYSVYIYIYIYTYTCGLHVDGRRVALHAHAALSPSSLLGPLSAFASFPGYIDITCIQYR